LNIGADVPFIVSPMNAAIATGLGEQLKEVALPTRYIVGLYPNIAVPTAAMFQANNLQRDCPYIDNAEITANLEAIVDGKHPKFSNVFLPILCRQNRAFAQIYHSFQEVAKPHIVRLSGSGSTLFITTQTEAEANRVKDCLQKAFATNNYFIFAVKTWG